MGFISDKILPQMAKCQNLLSLGYQSTKTSGITWLNNYCAEFLEFSNELHKFITKDITIIEGNDQIEIIFLCLTQITTCIKHLERTINAEEVGGCAILCSRQHFIDRIYWCLERLVEAIKLLDANKAGKEKSLEENTFVELMDMVLEHLTPYSTYNESTNISNIIKENNEALRASKTIRLTIDLILGHTLAFANVALKDDKKALSALCQKVLRECISFQEECALSEQQSKINDSNRKLKAISLENALYQLEDYINESLLRLVYTCFLDFSKFSIETLRKEVRLRDADDPLLDELVADFDVNVDRTTQIGIFAIAFSPNAKIKTAVRSCLASIESLDSCIIPSLYTKNVADVYSEILEQHFNEEVAIFKSSIQEIIDSYAYTACYQDLLSQCILKLEKEFNKAQAQEIIQMAEFLYEHFEVKTNRKELMKTADRQHCFEKFVLMLHECQAVLMCADQVDTKRILKRFKILRSTLRKFLDTLSEMSPQICANKTNVFLMSDELSDSQRMFESIGISPSIRSILYHNEATIRRRCASDSLKGNYSKLLLTPKPSTLVQQQQRNQAVAAPQIKSSKPMQSAQSERQCSIRRKESLRTAMFKRQKSTESQKIYNIYKNNSNSLQISDILDQLCSVSSNMANNLEKNKAIYQNKI